MDISEFFQLTKAPATVAHVISVIFGMGAALVSDLLFSFFAKDKKLNSTEFSTLDILSKVVLYSLVFISISGIFIFFSDVDKYLNSPKFLAKMSILVFLLVNGYLLNRYIWPHLLNKNFFTLKKERNIRRLAFVFGAVSVTSWLCVCVLGVLDKLNMSYSFIMTIYLGFIVVGSLVALAVEKKEFN